MDGTDTSPSAGMLRAAASCAEPIYAMTIRLRNAMYDAGILASKPAGRPTISIGNITTGGVGKTPVVQWLAKRLSALGQSPTVLMRGYKSTAHGVSDEKAILENAGIAVIADADRRRGAKAALAQFPQTTVFLLDDGMQHRRIARDFELALIHAAEPFGFNRVFPRGLLREPMSALARADAVLITHADEVDAATIAAITGKIREYNKPAPIFHCDHLIQNDLSGKKYFAFCGIGSPGSFLSGLNTLGGISAGSLAFDDHHDYAAADVEQISQAARMARAEVLVTTAKDAVKLERLAAKFPLPVITAQLSLRFHGDEEDLLLKAIRQGLGV